MDEEWIRDGNRGFANNDQIRHIATDHSLRLFFYKIGYVFNRLNPLCSERL